MVKNLEDKMATATYLEHDGEGPLHVLCRFSPKLQVPRLVLAVADLRAESGDTSCAHVIRHAFC